MASRQPPSPPAAAVRLPAAKTNGPHTRDNSVEKGSHQKLSEAFNRGPSL